MLTGTQLLKAVKNNTSSKSNLIRSCGYTKTNPDGTQKLLFTKFYHALLQAKGISLSPKNKKRKPSFHLSVHNNLSIILSKHYTSLLNLSPHQKLSIKIVKNSIIITPLT
jgi:hypothetical protein